jgi:hypothetical protein
MEGLPYIDAHGVDVAADVDTTWVALLRVVRDGLGGAADEWLGRALRVEPRHASGRWEPDLEPGAALAGFTVERARRPELLSLRGRHRFSRYRLDFELTAARPDETDVRTHVRARTWAEFPGLAGAAYRALVIGSGGHGLAVRRMLRRVAARAALAAPTTR